MTDAPDTKPDTEEPDTTGQDPDTPETEEQPDTVARTELNKAVERRDKAIKAARELRAELDALKAKDGKDGKAEPSEADILRDGMKRTAARAVLAASGVTDKDDQAEILSVLSLDGVEIVDGEPDTDTLEEKLTKLRRILGAPAKRTPRVEIRDRGGKTADPADRDKARYQRFMAGR